MHVSIPFEVLFVLYLLEKHDFKAYLVGGAVRDMLLNSSKKVKTAFISDYDFTTDALPSEIQNIFKESFYENDFGCVGISHQDVIESLEKQGFILPKENLQTQYHLQKSETNETKIINLSKARKIHSSLLTPITNGKIEKIIVPAFEITTFRSDGLYKDFRKPENVKFGDSLIEDLKRRDFTINALALMVNINYLEKLFSKPKSLKTQYLLKSTAFTLIDEHSSQKDLTNKLIKTVGDPAQRFKEDALRMLRAIRFASELNMAIDSETLQAISHYHELITHISQERIRDEFLKMLKSPFPDQAIRLLDNTGILKIILPELLTGKDIKQGGHHNTDVWTHSLDSLKYCPSSDPIVRLATLIHDIGKAKTQKIDHDQITFYNHEIISAHIAKKLAEKLKFSNDQKEKLVTLVRYHMFHYQTHNTDASVRRFMKKVGLKYIDDILDLREGDRLGSGARKTSWRLEEFKARIIEQLNQPFAVTDLEIDGHDLMTTFQLQPGPILGKILNHLMAVVLKKPELNTKDFLLKEAKKILQKE